MAIVTNVRAAREAAGYPSQVALANALTEAGLPWSKWKLGRAESGAQILTWEELRELAGFLHVTPADLYPPSLIQALRPEAERDDLDKLLAEVG